METQNTFIFTTKGQLFDFSTPKHCSFISHVIHNALNYEFVEIWDNVLLQNFRHLQVETKFDYRFETEFNSLNSSMIQWASGCATPVIQKKNVWEYGDTVYLWATNFEPREYEKYFSEWKVIKTFLTDADGQIFLIIGKLNTFDSKNLIPLETERANGNALVIK